MGCVDAVTSVVEASDMDVAIIVIGDGRTPRTAALLAMRTKAQVVSIDPALHGLCSSEGAAADYASLPRELRHSNLQKQQQSERALRRREKMRADVATLQRLHLRACKAQEAVVSLVLGASRGVATAPVPAQDVERSTVCLPLGEAGRVVLVLPHAHVTPDEALACLRFEGALGPRPPTISVVQLPCCGFVWHDSVCGLPPDHDALDARICASARAVRVWRDVSPRFDFGAAARGRSGVPRGLAHAQRGSEAHEWKRRTQRAVSRARADRRLAASAARRRWAALNRLAQRAAGWLLLGLSGRTACGETRDRARGAHVGARV
jgi:hypothetical protein